ncbi:MAG: PAS domain S-box protein, partial [Rickettsiales bacterium]|nr:PAS domain S-box protein [Rickettsiales bacterium]
MTTPTMSRSSKLVLLCAWLVFVTAGFIIIAWVAHDEVVRQEKQWQSKLELLAASQSRNVGAWVAQRREALSNLGDNLSLKLYMTELGLSDGNKEFALDEPAQLIFLRNLIFSTATNSGFVGHDDLPVRANVPRAASGGLLLQNERAEAVVSTRNMPSLSQLPPSFLTKEKRREPDFHGPFQLGDASIAVAFKQPVLPVQNDEHAAPIGQLIAVSPLDERFYRQLESVVPTGPSTEGLLVAWNDTDLTYFSPRLGEDEVFAQRSGASDPATVSAIQKSGRMVSQKDYRNKQVFALAQPVENARGWWLIRKVDRDVALGEATERARLWQISYLLCAALVTAAALAMFRHQSALRAKESARHYRQLANRIERQEQLLNLIAETSPVVTYILDADDKFRYVNRRAAEEFQLERETLLGKTLLDVVGPARAQSLLNCNQQALQGHASVTSYEQEVVDHMPIRALSREHIPLYAIPFGSEEKPQPGVLVLESDVTSLMQSQEKQKRTLNHLIRTVVAIVDQRDPHAAHHSACVSMIAEAVAHTMQLAAPLPQAAAVGGQLLNLGKILVPEALLVAQKIKEDDRDRIRASQQATADLLQGIDFTGPVVETIRQSQETSDGSG